MLNKREDILEALKSISEEAVEKYGIGGMLNDAIVAIESYYDVQNYIVDVNLPELDTTIVIRLNYVSSFLKDENDVLNDAWLRAERISKEPLFDGFLEAKKHMTATTVAKIKENSDG